MYADWASYAREDKTPEYHMYIIYNTAGTDGGALQQKRSGMNKKKEGKRKDSFDRCVHQWLFFPSVHINYNRVYRNIIEKASAVETRWRVGGGLLFVVFVVLTYELKSSSSGKETIENYRRNGKGLCSCFRFSRPAWFIEHSWNMYW